MNQRIANSIVIGNGKGGVGKTTLTANLAVESASQGTKIVLLDLDPQANLTSELGIEEHDQGKSLLVSAVLGDDNHAHVIGTGRRNLRICLLYTSPSPRDS